LKYEDYKESMMNVMDSTLDHEMRRGEGWRHFGSPDTEKLFDFSNKFARLHGLDEQGSKIFSSWLAGDDNVLDRDDFKRLGLWAQEGDGAVKKNHFDSGAFARKVDEFLDIAKSKELPGKDWEPRIIHYDDRDGTKHAEIMNVRKSPENDDEYELDNNGDKRPNKEPNSTGNEPARLSKEDINDLFNESVEAEAAPAAEAVSDVKPASEETPNTTSTEHGADAGFKELGNTENATNIFKDPVASYEQKMAALKEVMKNGERMKFDGFDLMRSGDRIMAVTEEAGGGKVKGYELTEDNINRFFDSYYKARVKALEALQSGLGAESTETEQDVKESATSGEEASNKKVADTAETEVEPVETEAIAEPAPEAEKAPAVTQEATSEESTEPEAVAKEALPTEAEFMQNLRADLGKLKIDAKDGLGAAETEKLKGFYLTIKADVETNKIDQEVLDALKKIIKEDYNIDNPDALLDQRADSVGDIATGSDTPESEPVELDNSFEVEEPMEEESRESEEPKIEPAKKSAPETESTSETDLSAILEKKSFDDIDPETHSYYGNVPGSGFTVKANHLYRVLQDTDINSREDLQKWIQAGMKQGESLRDDQVKDIESFFQAFQKTKDISLAGNKKFLSKFFDSKGDFKAS